MVAAAIRCTSSLKTETSASAGRTAPMALAPTRAASTPWVPQPPRATAPTQLSLFPGPVSYCIAGG